MAARLGLTKQFLRTRQAFDLESGSPVARRIAAMLRELEADWPNLPRPGDGEAFVPPMLRCWSRRVPGTDLEVWFYVKGECVWAVAVVAIVA